MSSATFLGDCDSEVVERVGELDAAARHPRMIASLEHERRVRCELLAGLVDAPLTAADQAGEDQCLRLWSGFRQDPCSTRS